MEAIENNSQSQEFNIRMRISDRFERPSDFQIAQLIKEKLIFNNEPFFNDTFPQKYEEAYNDILNSSQDGNRDEVESQFRDFIKTRETPFSVVSSYIKWRINHCCQEFLSYNNIEDNKLKVKVPEISFNNGSLIITFNLFITTLINIYYVYQFVNYIVNELSEDRFLNDRNFTTTITACPSTTIIQQDTANPADSPMQQDTANPADSPIQPNTAISSEPHKTKPFPNLISIALALSLIACLLAFIAYFNQYDENELKAIVKEQTEQVISKEVPKEVQEAIHNEKIN